MVAGVDRGVGLWISFVIDGEGVTNGDAEGKGLGITVGLIGKFDVDESLAKLMRTMAKPEKKPTPARILCLSMNVIP